MASGIKPSQGVGIAEQLPWQCPQSRSLLPKVLPATVATVLVHGRITMMLMLVVSEVLRLRIAFVPAIACHCSPGELERQQGKQSNG